jgi:hypothetical protein
VPATIIVGQHNVSAANVSLFLTFGAVIAGNIYAEILLRCRNCKWRIGSYGRAFVRSLPPRECLRCGTKLD